MFCAFCGQEISGDVHQFNGSPCHLECREQAYCDYEEELDLDEKANPFDYCDEPEIADLNDAWSENMDYHWDDGRYDDDPSPYDGNYSEM